MSALGQITITVSRCWNTERNQTDKNPCLHRAYLQLRETVKNKDLAKFGCYFPFVGGLFITMRRMS
ncbi:ZNF365 isoform 6 [Pan troglodytes]|uniref:ZNF365 isoform 5 n=1 Tax=Pan troglodytes TaxID=9598 RepID=A0A2J8NVB4_PANTR|nr:ZNF365 isoform 5 [Pan troglodytes]PNI75708.1 ZNF365 isoform 6 [Pan troglodytes]